MTFEEAHAAMVDSKKKWGGGSSEAWLINALVAVGALKLDEKPKTLWEILREYEVDVTTAQRICNQALIHGITRSPHGNGGATNG